MTVLRQLVLSSRQLAGVREKEEQRMLAALAASASDGVSVVRG
jgi:hypothetical protein